MLKYPVTILLILLIGLQTFSKWCVILEYQLNKDYIAKNLCVNRAKPSCCCHGKCYLTKKMTSDESQQQAPGKGGQKDESPLQVYVQLNNLPLRHVRVINPINQTRYLVSLSQELILSVFHPPEA